MQQSCSEVTNRLLPTSPKQRMASLIISAWADDWWEPFVLYFRLSHDKPKSNPVAYNVISLNAKRLDQHLASRGVIPEQFDELELWSLQCMRELENHFSKHDYLLGGCPCLADYALVVPIHAYVESCLVRTGRTVEARFSSIQRWLDKMQLETGENNASLLADDQLPETLETIFHRIFSEFFPMTFAFVAEIKNVLNKSSSKVNSHLPANLGEVIFPMGDQVFVRRCAPKSVQSMRIVQREYLALSAIERRAVDPWLLVNNVRRFGEMDLGPNL